MIVKLFATLLMLAMLAPALSNECETGSWCSVLSNGHPIGTCEQGICQSGKCVAIPARETGDCGPVTVGPSPGVPLRMSGNCHLRCVAIHCARLCYPSVSAVTHAHQNFK